MTTKTCLTDGAAVVGDSDSFSKATPASLLAGMSYSFKSSLMLAFRANRWLAMLHTRGLCGCCQRLCKCPHALNLYPQTGVFKSKGNPAAPTRPSGVNKRFGSAWSSEGSVEGIHHVLGQLFKARVTSWRNIPGIPLAGWSAGIP